MHTHSYIHACIYSQIYALVPARAYTRTHTHARPYAQQKIITFRCKKSQGRLNIHTCMQACTQHRHTLIPIHTRTDARMQEHANRQTHGCLRACQMQDYIHTYRQTGARRTACTHTRTNAYIRTHVHNTYISFVCLIFYVPVNSFSVMSDGRIFLG